MSVRKIGRLEDLDMVTRFHAENNRKQAKTIPVLLDREGKFEHYLYKDNIYKISRGGYSLEEIRLLILEFEDKEKKKFQRLKRKFGSSR